MTLRDARDVGAFIPAELDDYPLSTAEFRVYCRIVRRAGADGCYESNQAMSVALGIGERTIREAKALLCAAGLVAVERRVGRTDRYWLTSTSEWAEKGQLDGLRQGARRPRKATPVPRTAVPTTGHPGPQDRATAVPTTDEGTTREGSTSKGGRRKRTTALPDDWQPNDTHRAFADKHGLDLGWQADKFRDHAEANDRRQVSWDAAFRMWLRNAVKWGDASPKVAEPQQSSTLDRNARRARGEACERCADTGYVEGADGLAHICDHREAS